MIRLNPSVRESIASALADAREAGDLGAVGADLFTVAELLEREGRLRRPLTDSGLPAEAKRGLIESLFGGARPATLRIVEAVASGQRLHERDLPAVLDDVAAEAALADAEAADDLERVEDELFRFARLCESSADLRAALSDPALPHENKAALVRELLAGPADPRTLRLVEQVLSRTRGHDLDAALDRLLEISAARRDHVLAEARSAVELDAARRERLAEALSRAVGRPVELRVTVDPSLMGSLTVRVGDEVFDGSVRRQLELARERLVSR